ncbi:hypothetical protein ON010_g16100 [Phytophthora cinnamomi]|nr:hypothetical protein ON010_g16100 [Phytophthora cinnamomi]
MATSATGDTLAAISRAASGAELAVAVVSARPRQRRSSTAHRPSTKVLARSLSRQLGRQQRRKCPRAQGRDVQLHVALWLADKRIAETKNAKNGVDPVLRHPEVAEKGMSPARAHTAANPPAPSDNGRREQLRARFPGGRRLRGGHNTPDPQHGARTGGGGGPPACGPHLHPVHERYARLRAAPAVRLVDLAAQPAQVQQRQGVQRSPCG